MPYETDRKWSDGYHSDVKKALAITFADELFDTASDYKDQNEATDLTMVKSHKQDIAVRIRRPGWLQFVSEFTVRYHTAWGNVSEIYKIVNGFGDCMFYGHARTNNPADGLAAWMIIDLDEFRAEHQRCISPDHQQSENCGMCTHQDKQNVRGGSSFKIFNAEQFSNYDRLVIARKLPQ